MTSDLIRLEREFYHRILDLHAEEDIAGLLSSALSLILEIAGAKKGYIELTAPEHGAPFFQSWECSEKDVTDIRAAISGGIIAEAMKTGEPIQTASALLDPRFSARQSVRRNRIEAVLCAPIGTPPLGVVYLQGRNQPGIFSDDDLGRLKLFARHLAPLSDRLLARWLLVQKTDHTHEHRKELRNHEDIIGQSAALAGVLEQVARAAPIDLTVMISGPTGTGKSSLARLIADNSSRSSGPFQHVSCPNLPLSLIESQLFGAVRGAHSTATQSSPGMVDAAQGGTLFLDEIADLPLAAQSRLLQLLQNQIYYPVGSTRPKVADVRIIAASHKDLEEEVAAGRFRQDLMYRLVVFPIHLPPLSERPEDILPLAEHFCARACARYNFEQLPLTAVALSALQLAEWPGNIRQLENTLQRAVVIAATSGATRITPAHLFPGRVKASSQSLSFQQATQQFQRLFLDKSLLATNWNISQAAQQLDLSRSHLHALIKQHDIKKP